MRRGPYNDPALDILPLVCAACGRRWEEEVDSQVHDVTCKACGSRRVSVIPPVKIVDFCRANHYNKGEVKGRKGRKAARTEESSEPERVLHAFAREPEAEDIEEVIIVEEVG